MELRSFVLLLIISFLPAVAWAQEYSEMTVQLRGDGSAHVTIGSSGLANLEGLAKIVGDPAVAAIYRKQLASVFGPVGNLTLSLQGGTMVIEFDAPLAVEKESMREVEGRDFRGVKRMSSLRVRLPERAELVLAEPPGEELVGEWVWKDADALPRIVYRERPRWRPVLAAALAMALGVLAWRRLRG